MKYLKIITELFFIMIGCAISAVGVNMLIMPVHLLSGGVQGISLILNHYTNIGVGIFYFLFNIPLLILGHIHIGKKFSAYTAFGVIVYSLMLEVIKFDHFWTQNILLCSVFGALLSSIGSIIVLRCGGSTGGLDILGRVITKYKDITIGKFNLSINIFIILCCAFIFEVEVAMYTVISMAVATVAYDKLLNHISRISVFIITTKGKEVSEEITNKMRRGVTLMNANGAFTDNHKDVLVSVIVNEQWSDLRTIVKEVDPSAFIFVLPTQTVVGNFHKIW